MGRDKLAQSCDERKYWRLGLIELSKAQKFWITFIGIVCVRENIWISLSWWHGTEFETPGSGELGTC